MSEKKTRKRYVDVAQQMLNDLRSGRYEVGSSLPSEAALCERFRASRSTVRGAMAELQRLGMIERRQGASTRVLSLEAPAIYLHSMSASGDLMQFAGPSWRQVKGIEKIVADQKLAETLDDIPGRRWTLIRQTRHIEAQLSPVAWTDVYLAEEYSDIAELVPDFPGLIYTLLEQRHNLLIHEIKQSLQAVTVDAEIATALNVKEGDVALRMIRHYKDKDGKSQIISINTMPAENYRYEITLKRQAENAQN